ncbi:MAG: VacJ family lipoprotein [Verrucomicrobia bacterium]|nr:VacJ family lipoprotein [Verrucomicrobiota bacterium]
MNDPFERVNRTIFHFNDKVTTYALRPISRGYVLLIPRPVRNSISNFFDNLDFPVRFVNCVLQGRFVRSSQEVGKFVINSTVGIGGLFRVSDHVNGLTNVPPEDFGLTLGRWGFSSGPYLVAPVLGPSDIRDTFGLAGDYVINPLNWYTIGIIGCKYISNAANFALGGSRFVSRLPKLIDTYDQLKASAIDPYIAVRNAYLSYRAAQLKK